MSAYYDIALQMANSDFDYFWGESLLSPTREDDKQEDIFKIMEKNGYTVTNDKEE